MLGELFSERLRRAYLQKDDVRFEECVQQLEAEKRTSHTFEASRNSALESFDDSVSALRDIIADPTWCNELYPKYKEAVKTLNDSINRIRRLNEVEEENKPKER